MTLLPSSIEGLMGLWEEHLVSLFPLKGTRLDDSPRGWFSEPLDCPPNEGCSPEKMVGNDEPLGREPSPFQGGEEVSSAHLNIFIDEPLIPALILLGAHHV